MRKALSIRFREKPRDLEETLEHSPAYKPRGNSVWTWESSLGNIDVVVSENPYLLEIFADYNAQVIQTRINKLASRIKERNLNCKIEYNKEFYTL